MKTIMVFLITALLGNCTLVFTHKHSKGNTYTSQINNNTTKIVISFLISYYILYPYEINETVFSVFDFHNIM